MQYRYAAPGQYLVLVMRLLSVRALTCLYSSECQFSCHLAIDDIILVKKRVRGVYCELLSREVYRTAFTYYSTPAV